MADVFDKKIRSEVMSRIKGSNTKPELIVRRYLFSNGFRYRIHDKKLSGKPDIVLKKYHVVIFVNGCFWHGHKECKTHRPPKSNKKFWTEKLRKNSERDIRNIKKLTEENWYVLLVWECELKSNCREKTLKKLVENILSTPCH